MTAAKNPTIALLVPERSIRSRFETILFCTEFCGSQRSLIGLRCAGHYDRTSLGREQADGEEPDLGDVSEEDVERLASRLAMVVSQDGEAENAGRAMGQLARRLGLTGGQLKEIFLAGAAVSGPDLGIASQSRGDVGRLESEVAVLRRGLQESDAKLRAADRERYALQRDVVALRKNLRRSRRVTRSWLAFTGVMVVAGAAVVISLVVPLSTLQSLAGLTQPPVQSPPDNGADGRRMAVVHAGHTPMFQQPDRSAPVMTTLPAGAPVVVRRLVWNMLMQWGEVEVDGRVGYVLTTDLDLS
jgi:hypothetical protein